MSIKLILGLDLGITSVGWGIIDENFNIIDKGVRLFEESTADGNQKRRGFRSTRRLIRRKRARIIRMFKYLEEIEIIEKTFEYLENPYKIRVKGLQHKLTKTELATALLHLAKRRGSNLEVVEDDAEVTGDLSSKNAIKQNLSLMAEKKSYISEIQLERLDKNNKIRGHQNVFKTIDYIEETRKILMNQDLTEEQKDKIIHIIGNRRHFTEGPGSINAPTQFGRYRPVTDDVKSSIVNKIKQDNHPKYMKETFTYVYDSISYKIFKNGTIITETPINLIDIMKGKCSIYLDEYRATKRSFTAELYNLLNELNNIKFADEHKQITKNHKEEIIKFVKEKGNFTYANFKKYFDIKDDVEVSGFIQKQDKNILTGFTGFKKIHSIYKKIGIDLPNTKVIDSITDILASYPTVEDRTTKLHELKLTSTEINELRLLTGFSGTHSLSYKALDKFIDLMMEENLNQQQLRMKYQMAQSKIIDSIINVDANITNPVVRRVQLEAQKVIDELMNIHGFFDSIVIETTRDKNSKDQATNIRKAQDRNEKLKLAAHEIILESGYSDDQRLSAQVIQKIKLYNEQNQRCAYTGSVIDIGKLIRDPKAYEIDHIIPYSISFDDSLQNKVLVTNIANQLKGNRTPFGYFSQGLASKFEINNYETYKESVLNNRNYSFYKKENLLFEKDITKYSTQMEFKNRNLTDTSYAIRTFMNDLKDYFSHNHISTKVFTIKGKQTSLFRRIAMHQWHKNNPNSTSKENPFNKSRDFYMHHAIDALIVAALYNQSTFKRFFQLETNDESTILYNDTTGELLDNNPLEDPTLYKFFNALANATVKDEFKYSWKIDYKPNRSFSDQTIYSTRIYDDEEHIVKKENIYELKNDKAKKIFEDEKQFRKLLIYRNDPKTFEAIEKAYKQYKHETYPFKTYMDNHGPIRKYSKKGNGAVVTNIKYLDTRLGNFMDISHKYEVRDKKVVKLQLSTYRIDIYFNNSIYKFITLRYNHMAYNASSNRYEINKDIYESLKKEKGIDNSFKFIFSLVRNSIFAISIKQKNEIQTELYRFITTSNDKKNLIETKLINKVGSKRYTPGISKNVVDLEKYNVSVTGKISKVEKEDLKLVI